jgi:hypothetical protein
MKDPISAAPLCRACGSHQTRIMYRSVAGVVVRCDACGQSSNVPWESFGVAEWYIELLRTRANVLLTGPRAKVDTFLAAVHPELLQPVLRVPAPAPWPKESVGTLVVIGVDELTAAGQLALSSRIESHTNANLQLIFVSSRRLFPMVNLDQFDPDVYYRLNTIHFDLIGDDAP